MELVRTDGKEIKTESEVRMFQGSTWLPLDSARSLLGSLQALTPFRILLRLGSCRTGCCYLHAPWPPGRTWRWPHKLRHLVKSQHHKGLWCYCLGCQDETFCFCWEIFSLFPPAQWHNVGHLGGGSLGLQDCFRCVSVDGCWFLETPTLSELISNPKASSNN